LVNATALSGVANTGNITITSTDYYVIKCFFNTFSAADTVWFRFNNDSASAYAYRNTGTSFGGASLNASSGADTKIPLSTTINTVDSNDGFYLELIMHRQAGTTGYRHIAGKSWGRYSAGGDGFFYDFCGRYTTGAETTSFRLLSSAGATFSGNVYVYKYALS